MTLQRVVEPKVLGLTHLILTFEEVADRVQQGRGGPHVTDRAPRTAPRVKTFSKNLTSFCILFVLQGLPVRLGNLPGLGMVLQVGHEVLQHLAASALLHPGELGGCVGGALAVHNLKGEPSSIRFLF